MDTKTESFDTQALIASGMRSLSQESGSKADAAIAEIASQYMQMKIQGIDDREGFKAVHDARMVVKGTRVEIEKTRKEMKADALEWGRRVDAEARRLTSLLEPIEAHLQAEEDRIIAEKEAIRNAAKLKAEAEARAKREAEEAAMRAEQERLAEERRKIEAERAALEAAKRRMAEEEAARQRAIAEERRKAEEAELERKRAIELEKARAEAAELAKAETEARMKREAEEREAEERRKAETAELSRQAAELARRQAEAEAARREAMRPDREKLLKLADEIAKINIPDTPNTPAHVRVQVSHVVLECAQRIREIVKKQLPEVEGNLT